MFQELHTTNKSMFFLDQCLEFVAPFLFPLTKYTIRHSLRCELFLLVAYSRFYQHSDVTKVHYNSTEQKKMFQDKTQELMNTFKSTF